MILFPLEMLLQYNYEPSVNLLSPRLIFLILSRWCPQEKTGKKTGAGTRVGDLWAFLIEHGGAGDLNSASQCSLEQV